ncbi:hypothetical protein B0H10DRAFT_2438687, partial [Mycena sp. CBHHK59/15]
MDPNLVFDASGHPTNPNLLFDTSGQTYHTSGQPYEHYDPSAQPYNNSGQPYEHYDPSAQPYDNSGQPYEHYDPTAYDNSGQTYDTAVQHYGAGGQLYETGGQVYNEAAPQDAAPQDGWIDPAQIQPGPPQIDVATLLAAHNELSKKLNRMNLQYNDTVNNTIQQQMKAYQESVDDDVKALRVQRDAAQAQAEATARQMSETIARLERE